MGHRFFQMLVSSPDLVNSVFVEFLFWALNVAAALCMIAYVLSLVTFLVELHRGKSLRDAFTSASVAECACGDCELCRSEGA